MFDRFSDNAKQMMSLARAAANRHRNGCIDAEHILIGMLEVPSSNACMLLRDQGIDIESLRSAMDTLLPRGTASEATNLPFSPSAKRVLELALHTAAELRQSHIGSHHLLLGILSDDCGASDSGASDNDARQLLLRVGADLEALSQAMIASIPQSQRERVNLLLISNSTMHGGGYLEHCKHEIQDFLGKPKRVMFVPFALADHDAYANKAREAFVAMGHAFGSVHTYNNKQQACDEADAVFIGGGNTFRLLSTLQHHGLIPIIQKRVLAGMPYIGSSAGTNVATPSIRTTNDMPIVQPASFTALQLVPFQINPHYLDPDPGSSHMGETREERIQQFHEEHEVPVLGLREGCMLRVHGPSMQLKGTTNARLFRRAQDPVEFQPPCDLSFLLAD